jgi:hypothetical protein
MYNFILQYFIRILIQICITTHKKSKPMKKVFLTLLVAAFAIVVFGQTKTEIKQNDLPSCISEWMKVNLKGYTIDKAFKVDNSGVISYLVRTTKGKEMVQWLEADAKCTISLKKVTEPEPAPKPKPPQPEPKPSSTPAPKK